MLRCLYDGDRWVHLSVATVCAQPFRGNRLWRSSWVTLKRCAAGMVELHSRLSYFDTPLLLCTCGEPAHSADASQYTNMDEAVRQAPVDSVEPARVPAPPEQHRGG